MRLVPVVLLVACSADPLHQREPERSPGLARGREPLRDFARAAGPPALPGATWSVIGDQAFGKLGVSTASAGDVNGDGYADLVVGASGYDRGQSNEGVALLYLGSAAGLSIAPVWIGEGGQVDAALGSGVASAGDVNGDGYDDVLVGAYGWDGGQRDEGLVRLYLGSAAGLAAAPAWSAESDQAGSSFGSALAGAGDVNGDGYDDVILGAWTYDAQQAGAGMARVYLGSAAGLSATPDWTRRGTQANESFGRSVSGAGDLNGDGFADVIVGAPGHDDTASGEGAAFVYLGSAAGLSTVPSWSVVGGDVQEGLGQTVSNAGDVNADGFGDVLVAAPAGGNGGQIYEGRVELYLGSAAGLGAASAWTIAGDVDWFQLGYSLGAAGDLDGDGYEDVIVGHDGSPSGARVYLGRSSGLSPTPALVFEDLLGDNGPSSVASAGDVDGDGLPDLTVGLYAYDGASTDAGAVFVFTDAAADADGDGVFDLQDLCVDAPDPAQLDTDGDGVGNACDAPTLAVVGVVSSGATVTLEVTGVAPGEVVQFGAAVGRAAPGPCPASLGGLCLDLGAGAVQLGTDVADAAGVASRRVVVPAAVQPGGTYVVQAAIRRGAAGVDSTKSPPVVLDPDVLDWDGDGLVDADEDTIGTDPRLVDSDSDGLTDLQDLGPHLDPLDPDADGDGVDDDVDACLAGDDAADSDLDGHANACDLCPVDADPGQADADGDGLGNACEGAVVVGPGWTTEGDALVANLGTSVSGGDVNGDGFPDVIVGAYRDQVTISEEGVIEVFFGSAAGISAVADQTLAGDSPTAWAGYSVAAVGDVDGDGFDDVLVGAPGDDTAGAGGGSVALYLGSAAGLDPAPTWRLTSDQPSASFGYTVASAGDVNGDGLADLVAGAPNGDSPGVTVWLGSPGGPGSAPDWSVPGARDSHFGTTVVSADVNADGFDDLLVGATGWYGSPDGTVDLYLGSPTGLGATSAWHREETQGWQYAVALAAADLNGDGFDDVAISTATAGRVEVFFGGQLGLQDTPAWTLLDDQSRLGASLAALDLDGDGYDDLAIANPDATYGQVNEGAVFVYLGSETGLASAAAGRLESNLAVWFDPWGYGHAVEFGDGLAAAGDLDGDGRADLLVGTPGFDGVARDSGSASVYLGRSP